MLSGDSLFFDFLTFASASPAEMCAVRTRRRLLEQRFDSVCADCSLVANNVQLCRGRGGSDCQFVKLSRADGALLCWAEVCTPHKKLSQLISKREDINTNLLAAISARENVTMPRTNRPTPLKRGSLQKTKRSRSDVRLPLHKRCYRRGGKKQLFI